MFSLQAKQGGLSNVLHEERPFEYESSSAICEVLQNDSAVDAGFHQEKNAMENQKRKIRTGQSKKTGV